MTNRIIGINFYRKRKRRQAETVDDLRPDLSTLLSALGGNPQMARLAELWRSWEDILGADLAALVSPLGADKRRLLGGVEDALAMQEAQYQKDEILQKVNEWLNDEYFEEVSLSLMFGREARDGEAKGRYAPGNINLTAEQALPKSRATGSFLNKMDPNSAVARAYAVFARKQATGKKD